MSYFAVFLCSFASLREHARRKRLISRKDAKGQSEMKTLPEKRPHRGEMFMARSSEFLFSEMSEVFHAESVKLNSRRHHPRSPGRRVAFRQKYQSGSTFVNPHPNPHVGEGEKKNDVTSIDSSYTVSRPVTRLIIRTTRASTSNKWMNPPNV